MGDGLGDFAFWLAMGGLFLGFTLGPIGRAAGRWIEARSRARELPPEWDDRLAEVDTLQQRLGELEERLDCAERLLAQHRAREVDGVDTPPEQLPAVR